MDHGAARRVGRESCRSCAVAIVALALLALAGCENAGLNLTVRAQTGFRAGYDFTALSAEVHAGSLPCVASAAAADRAVFATDQAALERGELTVLVADGLRPGVHTVRVALRRPDGSEVASRCVITSMSADRVIRVAITVDCLGVTCPAPGGDPTFDQCLNGRCVEPDCDLDDPSTHDACCDRSVLGALCDDRRTPCDDAMDCETTLTCSGPPRCQGGACVEPADDACPDGTYCAAAENDCVPLGASDAGARDAGVIDVADVGPADAPGADVASACRCMGCGSSVAVGEGCRLPDGGGPCQDCSVRWDCEADGSGGCALVEQPGTRSCEDTNEGDMCRACSMGGCVGDGECTGGTRSTTCGFCRGGSCRNETTGSSSCGVDEPDYAPCGPSAGYCCMGGGCVYRPTSC